MEPHGLQHFRLPCTSLSPRVCSNSCPLTHWYYLPISSSPPTFFFAFNLFQHRGLLQWVSFSHKVVKVLELYLQHESFQWIFRVAFLEYWLICSPCRLRDSQESSSAPHLESINSLALSLLYGLTLIYVHDSWKNHSFDYMNFCLQSEVCAFKNAF